MCSVIVVFFLCCLLINASLCVFLCVVCDVDCVCRAFVVSCMCVFCVRLVMFVP